MEQTVHFFGIGYSIQLLYMAKMFYQNFNAKKHIYFKLVRPQNAGF